MCLYNIAPRKCFCFLLWSLSNSKYILLINIRLKTRRKNLEVVRFFPFFFF